MKQKTATKALRWLAALALAGGVMTAMSATVWAVDYPLWVGGTQVSDSNMSGAGWSFAPADGTNPAKLTLDGYSFTGAGYNFTEGYYSPIYWNSSDDVLVIELKGENSITATDNSNNNGNYGVYAKGSLMFQGTGSLVALGGAQSCRDNSGIYASEDISIDECSITARSYNAGIVAEGSISFGENTGNVIAESGEEGWGGIYAHNLTVNGGAVTANATSTDDSAYAVYVVDTLEVKGGTVTANATSTESYAYGIYVDEENMDVSGGEISVEATSDDYAYGIYVYYGDMDVSGGEISVEAAGDSDAYGINVYGAMDVSGGEISVEVSSDNSYAYGIYVYKNMTVSGGEISVEATGGYSDAYGIYVYKNMTVSGGEISVEATGGYSDAYGIKVYDGDMDVSGGEISVEVSSDNNYAYGINVYYGDMDVSGGEISIEATSGYYAYGIYSSYGDLMTVSDGKLSIEATGDRYAYGILNYYPEMNVSGGEIFIKSVNHGEISGNHSAVGIYNCCDTDMSGGNISIESISDGFAFGIYAYDAMHMESGEISIECSTKIAFEGIYVYDPFTMDSGKISVKGTGNSISSDYDSVGIYFRENSVIKGGEIYVECTGVGTYGIWTGQDLTMDGGKIDASGADYAVCASGSFSINGGEFQAIANGDEGVGVQTDSGLVTIGDKVTSFLAAGKKNAFAEDNMIKNAISGTAWTNFEGTEGQVWFDVPTMDGWDLEDYQRVVFPGLHMHHFTYQVDGTTIIATCDGPETCDLPDNKVTLTMTVPAIATHSGSSTAAILTGLDEFNAATGNNLSAKSVSYYKATKDGETYVKDGEALAEEPKTPGDYLAEITVTDEAEQEFSIFVGYTIANASQTAPEAPVVTATTSDSITVKTVRGVEFSIDGVHWQTSGTFTGLKPDTTYVIQARKVATEYHDASPSSKTVVNTPAAQSQPTTWRFGLRLLNALNLISGARQTVTTWNPWQPRTIWTPWWLRR